MSWTIAKHAAQTYGFMIEGIIGQVTVLTMIGDDGHKVTICIDQPKRDSEGAATALRVGSPGPWLSREVQTSDDVQALFRAAHEA